MMILLCTPIILQSKLLYINHLLIIRMVVHIFLGYIKLIFALITTASTSSNPALFNSFGTFLEDFNLWLTQNIA